MHVSVLFRELKHGIPVTDENGNRLGESPNAAKQAIMQVVVSRIGMAVPAMGKVNATLTYIFLSPTKWLIFCVYTSSFSSCRSLCSLLHNKATLSATHDASKVDTQ